MPPFSECEPHAKDNESLLQYMTEKMGGAEGTKLDVDFVDMERVSGVFLRGSFVRTSRKRRLVCSILYI